MNPSTSGPSSAERANDAPVLLVDPSLFTACVGAVMADDAFDTVVMPQIQAYDAATPRIAIGFTPTSPCRPAFPVGNNVDALPIAIITRTQRSIETHHHTPSPVECEAEALNAARVCAAASSCPAQC